MIPPEIFESGGTIPIIAEADICVLGGSCTGLFAAIRASRLGAKVVIVEKQNCFGGVATLSMVNIWHSPLDWSHQNQIFAGLTTETIHRLVAGRMIDADSVAHAGIRVMVNMNQTGEAAGVAAYAALDANIPIRKVSPTRVRTELAKCGAIIL